MIPPALATLFWNHDPGQLDLERSRELIILTALRRGTWEQVQLIFDLYGAAEIRRVFRVDALGPKTLPAPCVYLWGLLFLEDEELTAYKQWHEEPLSRWRPTRMARAQLPEP
jgi:hypothetical protein